MIYIAYWDVASEAMNDFVQVLGANCKLYAHDNPEDILEMIEHKQVHAICMDLDFDQKAVEKFIKLLKKTGDDSALMLLTNKLKSKQIVKHQRSKVGADLYLRTPLLLESITPILEEYAKIQVDNTDEIITQTPVEADSSTPQVQSDKKLSIVSESKGIEEDSIDKVDEVDVGDEKDQANEQPSSSEPQEPDEVGELTSATMEIDLDAFEEEDSSSDVQVKDNQELDENDLDIEDQPQYESSLTTQDYEGFLESESQKVDSGQEKQENDMSAQEEKDLELDDNLDNLELSSESESESESIDNDEMDLSLDDGSLELLDEENVSEVDQDIDKDALSLDDELGDLSLVDEEAIDQGNEAENDENHTSGDVLSVEESDIGISLDESLIEEEPVSFSDDVIVDDLDGDIDEDDEDLFAQSHSSADEQDSEELSDIESDPVNDSDNLDFASDLVFEEEADSSEEEVGPDIDDLDFGVSLAEETDHPDVQEALVELNEVSLDDDMLVESSDEDSFDLGNDLNLDDNDIELTNDQVNGIQEQSEVQGKSFDEKLAEIDQMLQEENSDNHGLDLGTDIVDDTLTALESSEQTVVKKVEKASQASKNADDYNDLVSYNQSELERLGSTISALREDREALQDKINEMQVHRETEKREFLNIQSELDEKKVEISLLRKKFQKLMADSQYKESLGDDKKRVLEEQNKMLRKEIEELSRKVHVDVQGIKNREYELENKLELLKRDAQAQIKNRDQKILELKRKIDTLEFDLDNLRSREKRTLTNKYLIEEKMSKVISTLKETIDDLEVESVDSEKDLDQ